MKWAYYVKYKLTTVAVLAGIMIVIIVGNLMERSSFSSLDNSMSSIYEDRLQVSRYIYDISTALYEKRMAISEQASREKDLPAIITTRNNMINKSVLAYEKTVLTAEEKAEWKSFKTHLADYNRYESSYLANAGSRIELDRQFEQTTANLDVLIQIQVGEGQHILQESHTMVSNRLSFSFLEISLLIVLGLCSLIIISTIDKNLFQNWQNQAMN